VLTPLKLIQAFDELAQLERFVVDDQDAARRLGHR